MVNRTYSGQKINGTYDSFDYRLLFTVTVYVLCRKVGKLSQCHKREIEMPSLIKDNFSECSWKIISRVLLWNNL